MHTKIFALAVAALLGVAFVGCGEAKKPRASKKSSPSTSSETSTTTASNDKASTPPAETTTKAAPAGDAPATGDWGTLKGKFVFNGTAPTPEPIKVDKDPDVCGKHNLVDESLVVGEGGGLANVTIWVRSKVENIHPDYDSLKKEKVVIDNKDCRFTTRVATYWTGQPLELKNSDPIAHNINAGLQVNDPFNEIVPADKFSDHKPLEKGETYISPLSCNIHGWMKGFVLVQPHPYMAVSAKDGTFEIKNLPTGTELEFQVWQEKSGYVQKAEIDGKDAKWAKGRFKYTIKAGDNDLGTIKLDPAQFNKS